MNEAKAIEKTETAGPLRTTLSKEVVADLGLQGKSSKEINSIVSDKIVIAKLNERITEQDKQISELINKIVDLTKVITEEVRDTSAETQAKLVKTNNYISEVMAYILSTQRFSGDDKLYRLYLEIIEEFAKKWQAESDKSDKLRTILLHESIARVGAIHELDGKEMEELRSRTIATAVDFQNHGVLTEGLNINEGLEANFLATGDESRNGLMEIARRNAEKAASHGR